MAAVADPPEAPVKRVTPLEPRPPSMAPGLGTIGGAPTDADSPAKPPDAEVKPAQPQAPVPIEPKPPSMAPGLGTTGGGPPPVRQEAPLPPAPSQQSQQNGALPKGFTPDEEKEGKAGLLPKGFIPDEQKEEEKPLPKGFVSEEEGQKKAVPPPISEKPAPVQAAAPPAAQVPTASDQNVLYRSLLDQGHSPGAAQAIVAGQEPKTLTGETPPAPEQKPEEKPAAPVPETVDWRKLGYKSFEDYQNFVNTLGIHTAVRGPGTTATLVEKGQADQQPSQPSTTTKDEKPAVIGENRLYGTSTIFGLNYDKSIDPDDNGRGFFGGVNTRNPNLRGVAVPVDVLEGIFGKFTKKNAQGGYDALDTPEAKAIIAKIRSAHVELPDPSGKMHKFPIVDIQGSVAGHPGKVLDLTYGATKELGFTDNHAVSYQIIGGDGKPYPIPDIELTRGGKDGGPAAGPAVGPAGPWISVGGAPSGGGAAPAQFRGPSEGGGSGAQPDYSPSESRAEPMSLAGLGGLLTGAAAGFALRGGQQAAQPSEEKGPSPSDVVAKVLAAGGPPPAPGAAPVDLSTMKPANVLSVKTPGAPQLGLAGPPPAPSAAPTTPDPSVVKGLMKAGFTFEQANAFAAKAKVSKPGAAPITGGASFRKPAQLPAPPPAPSRQPPAAAKPQPPAPQPQAPPRPVSSPQAGVAPRGSTVGIAKPAGSEALEGVPLAQAVKQHAALLSPDDPRVKKQADGMFKGEHFVPGDPVHDPALAGLPGGHGGRQRQIIGEAEQAIAEKRPLHVSYISAPQEAAKFPTRESRTIQYDEHSPEARLMGTTEGQLVGHSMMPVSVGIKLPKKAGEPHQSYIQGISTNVLANNFQHVNTKLAAMGQKTPYAKLGPKFSNDLEGYLSNLIAGHTGTGRGYAVGTPEYPNEPDTSHVPYKLTRREADFLNTVINNTGAFAKHEDGQALRELARVNGTLITPEGETNRMRREMEQHEPGWRNRMLEPSIRSFKTGLIHEVHPIEEHLPATIRPGQEYRDLTAAMARTSERGRPDVPVSVSLHHTFADNKAINQIERDFSEKRISEADARQRLQALGEDPDEYQFVGGSGGLITPYEENPEAITPEEHSQLKDNLRKQWIGGKLDVDDYRKKTAEVPLPELPSRPAEEPSAPTKQKTAEALDHFAKLNELHKELGTKGLQKLLQTKKTVRELSDEYGLKIVGEKLDTPIYGAMAFGPKIGALLSNLTLAKQPSSKKPEKLGGVLKMQGGGLVPDQGQTQPAQPSEVPALMQQPVGQQGQTQPAQSAQPVQQGQPSDFTSMIYGQPLSQQVPTPRATPAARATPAPSAPGIDTLPDPTRLGGLVDSRARYAKEISDHPELRGKVMAITDAEVGDDNPQAKQALIETIFNRAASRGMSLSATLASRHNPKTGTGYWAQQSWDKANAMSPQYIQDNLSPTYNPMIDRALAGSNVSNLSTGNQSGSVKSEGAPISFNPQGKRGNTFVIENRDAKWVAGMKKAQTAGSGEPETTSWTSPSGISSVPAAPAYDEYED